MYRRVLQIEPTDSDALNNLALILQNSRVGSIVISILYLLTRVQSDYNGAKILFEQALSACPEDLSTVNNLVRLSSEKRGCVLTDK